MLNHHPVERLRIEGRRLSRKLRGSRWFPHLPVTALVFIGATWLLYDTLGQQRPSLYVQLASGELSIAPALLAPAIVGCGLLIVSIGLAFRSRIAWTTASFLLITVVVSGLAAGYDWSNTLLVYLALVAVLLLLSWRSFDHANLAASTLFSISSIFMLFAYATYGSLYLGADFKPPIEDLVTALYYATATMSTVGYGDIIPSTANAKLFAISLIVFGVAVFATSLTTLVAPLLRRSMEHMANGRAHRVKRESHFVVLGQSALAQNTCKELRNRGQPVTRILRHPPEGGTSQDDDIVVGDAGNAATLREAGCDKATAILAMLEDDSENAFAILAVRELGTEGRTVAAVNNPENLGRVRLVKPDIVIAPQVLGGELAAMLVCGEEITPEFMVKRVIQGVNADG